MIKIENKEDFLNPNNVKVVTDPDGFAMYFSRAPIPYSRDKVFEKAFKHIGVYAFRKEVLEEIAGMPPTDLEQIEKLENLRFLQNGMMIKMLETDTVNFGIDTEEDLQQAIDFIKNHF
jgi:3-deoxy-manno-octulosonate cytidylyltransferase (CMP-KDO synthetase)